jgi:hypothetical protein
MLVRHLPEPASFGTLRGHRADELRRRNARITGEPRTQQRGVERVGQLRAHEHATGPLNLIEDDARQPVGQGRQRGDTVLLSALPALGFSGLAGGASLLGQHALALGLADGVRSRRRVRAAWGTYRC